MAALANVVSILNPAVQEKVSMGISLVDPTRTPFLSSLSRRPAGNEHPEWLVDKLNPLVTTARPYGDQYTVEARNNPERRRNYVQSMWNAVSISDEEEAADHYGYSKRMTREMMKIGKEQKNAIETILIGMNQASDAPTASNDTTGTTASFLPFLTTSVQFATGGANGGWNSTTKEIDGRTDAPAGNRRAFTEDHLKTALTSLWEVSEGIEGVTVYVNAKQKQVFNSFSGIAPHRMQVPTMGGMKQATTMGAVNVYVSDFGNINVALNRWMRDEDVLLMRRGDCMLKTFWMFRPRRLALKGNSREWGLSSSFTLKVTDERNHAAIFDCLAA